MFSYEDRLRAVQLYIKLDKRIVSNHAYLFGDAVKPPGAKGQLDASALAQLESLLKGAP